jgi:hypothetical protein
MDDSEAAKEVSKLEAQDQRGDRPEARKKKGLLRRLLRHDH